MRTITYIGPGGERHLGTEDGVSVALSFVRGVPTEISEANADFLLAGPHAAEFVEGEPEQEIEIPDAGLAPGAMTDETGSADPAGSSTDDQEA